MTVPANSTAAGTQLDQWDCVTPIQNNQRWVFEWTSGDFARLKNVHSGLCANVNGASTANGAAVIQWPCGNFDNEQWKGDKVATEDGLDYYQLKAKHSGKCLVVTNANPANGARLIQWQCSDPFDGSPNDVVTWVGPL